jgi:hypothetical protein
MYNYQYFLHYTVKIYCNIQNVFLHNILKKKDVLYERWSRIKCMFFCPPIPDGGGGGGGVSPWVGRQTDLTTQFQIYQGVDREYTQKLGA